MIYDVIIFDVNNNDSQSPLRCPHPAFLDKQILDNVQRLLADQYGLFVLNFASRDHTNEQRDDCLKCLSTNFNHLSSIKVDDDINEIIFASKQSLINLKLSKKFSQENLSFNFDIEELLSKVHIEK